MNNNGKDAAGNLLNGPADATKAAQASLDAARGAMAKEIALDTRNNSYTPPAAAARDPGWTVDPVTGHAVPPSR